MLSKFMFKANAKKCPKKLLLREKLNNNDKDSEPTVNWYFIHFMVGTVFYFTKFIRQDATGNF